MTLFALLSGAAAFALAFANGANDNSKGVATLIGCGRISPRTGLLLGTVLTFLGSVAGLLFASELIHRFSGKGVLVDDVILTAQFPMCVGIAAAATVLLATRLGMPISTTHALVGSLVGVGLASEIIWEGIWQSFIYPLLAAPFLAAMLTIPVYLAFHLVRKRSGITRESCMCVGRAEQCSSSAAVSPDGVALKTVEPPSLAVTTGHLPECNAGLQGNIIGIDAQRVLDWSHIFTACAVSFARGLNDTPKIAAILILAIGGAETAGQGLEESSAIIAIAIGMAAGGLLAARRVAHTMSRRITEMNDGQAFTANLVTAGLVILASRFGVPVSTTHVSCGSLFGIGAANRTARWRVIGTILLAWVTTLPLAGVIAYVMWQIVG